MNPCEAIEKLNKLVDDLFWDQDRMSSSGVETLNELADLVDNIQGVILNEHKTIR